MAKEKDKRGREGQTTAPPSATPAESAELPDPAEVDVEPMPVVAAPWRRIGLCLETCSIAFIHGSNKVLGGDWITSIEHTRVIEQDPHFRMYDATSPEHMAEIVADHAVEVEKLKRRAKDLGMAVYQDGSMVPARR